LLACVDEIGVEFVFGRERTDAQQAVLGLQGDVHVVGYVVGHERRDPDAQIDVVAVTQLGCSPSGHPLADRRFAARGRGRVARRPELDPLLVAAALDDAVDVDAGYMYGIGIDLADPDELFDFGDADRRAGGDRRIEVAGRAPEHEVAVRIALPRLHDGQVRTDRLLEHVVDAAELAGGLTFGQGRPEGRARVEGRYASTSGAQSLGQGALWHELELQFACEHLPLELAIFAHVGRNDLPD